MLFAENQHISKRPNTAIAQNGPKTADHPKQKTGHAAQNRVTSSQLFCAYCLTSLALHLIKAPICPRIFKNRRNKPILPACRGAHLPCRAGPQTRRNGRLGGIPRHARRQAGCLGMSGYAGHKPPPQRTFVPQIIFW